MKQLVKRAGHGERFLIQSAGTGAYHVGEKADSRSAAFARQQGIELTSRARQFVASDFDSFDYVVAMDRKNFNHLKQLARTQSDSNKVSLLRSFDPHADDSDVPDPYFEDNFGEVFAICHAGCAGLLDHVLSERGLRP
jgi:protein-tyrosine phosphatase